jgi:hypothetical protein
LRFTETMQGSVTFGADAPECAAPSEGPGTADLAVRLTVGVGGLYRFLSDPRHEAQLTGWVKSDALGGKLPIENGVFNLFVKGRDPRFRKMLYRVFFRDGTGHMLTLTGEKRVPQRLAFQPWRDTTTLYTRVLQGRIEEKEEGTAKIAAAGIIRMTPFLLLRQLLSFRASGSHRLNPVAGANLIARFHAFFVGTLADIYLRR